MTTMLIGDGEIFSVSQFNARVRDVLERNFPLVRLEGEISNLATPSSGHLYFSLKDASAQVRCAFFRGKQRQLNFTPKDGMQVVVQANVSLYEGRGDFQLIINQMELAGAGALRLQFELLKTKLAQEQLFDSQFKKTIPAAPRCIGVITSPTGAAVHDILTTLKRRYSLAPVIIYPTAVQGEKAAKQIIDALNSANQRNECDVLILARGGGSLEDLWCFNDEALARAIFKSAIPIVSGTGHEIDFTIADFVADVRAATPTAAAELVSPDQQQGLEQLRAQRNRLIQLMQQRLKLTNLQLQSLKKQLRHPGQIIREQIQTVDFLEQKMLSGFKQHLAHLQTQLQQLTQRFKFSNPQKEWTRLQEKINGLAERQQQGLLWLLKQKQQSLQHAMQALNTVSPLATLERGYSISRDLKTSQIIRSVANLAPEQQIEVILVDGRVQCEVKSKKRMLL